MIVMDFNNFFNGNEYILLGILFYFLFNNERHKEDLTSWQNKIKIFINLDG